MRLPLPEPRSGSLAPRARTIIDLLGRRAESQPERTAFTFLGAADGHARTITLRELDARARAVAGRLVGQGLGGAHALLLYPAGLEFVEAFFGCLYAGVVAVPAFPPRANRNLSRLAAIAADSGAPVALTAAGWLARSREIASAHPALGDLRWVATDGPAGAGNTPSGHSAADPGALAYLQYTSGSTSDPKGVMITHANILANSEDIRLGFRHGEDSRSLTWLPHFHDMGLVDGILQPVYSGFPAVLMDPASFLQSPARWLGAISEHRITHSGGPNFAYDLCARHVAADPAALDLRSWEVAYNGAEPVRSETLERFAGRFAACGFRREAFYPAYGLAEATLKVSGGSRGEGPTVVRLSRSSLEAGRAEEDGAGVDLVGAGRPGPGTRVAVVDPELAVERSENEVGELWVSGPGVASGYWNREEETSDVFRVRLAGAEGVFLRTGDLGFVRGDEVFVTGRLKDLIIVRGRNVYPQDVERTAGSCDAALRPGGGAAFGVEVEGVERLVLVHELERRRAGRLDGILAVIRTAIVETHEVDPWAVVLVKQGGVPKTSSGKVQRGACRRAFLEGMLPVVDEWRASAAAEDGASEDAPDDPASWLAWRIAAKLGVAPGSIDWAQPLARYGLDSLRSIELAHEIEVRFDTSIAPVELLAASSLSDLSARVGALFEPRASRAPAAGRGLNEDRAKARSLTPGASTDTALECPLSAGQRALWFLQKLAPESAAYTIASALSLTGPLEEGAFEAAARALIERHASLRARIVERCEGPVQRFDVPFERIFTWGNLRDAGPEELGTRLADDAYRPFDLAEGPLFRMSIVRTGTARVLLIAAHHAVADLWSLSIILKDLQSLYAAQLRMGSAPQAGPPHPYDFVRWQEGMLDGEEGARQLAFWRERLAGVLPALDLPTDRSRPPSQTFRGGVRFLRLDASLTSGLRAFARARGVTLYTLLLAAYQVFVGRISGQRELLVGAPASGRTRSRFSGLVAYLVNPVVLRADLRDDPTFEDLLSETRDRVLAALARQDYPFAELVKRLAPERDPSRSPFFDTMFDFHSTGDTVRGDLGSAGSGGRAEFARGVTGEPLDLERRASQFDLSVTVMDDGRGLSAELEYNADLFDAATVDAHARRYLTLLGSAVDRPRARVSRLAVLGPGERAAALRASNAPVEAVAVEPVHRLFERQAARRPAAIAVFDGARCLSYAELNGRSNALALQLRALGLVPEMRVALCAPKSSELLVGLLAVLKAGGAYVPIEPSLPAARRRFMIEDSGARLALARADTAEELEGLGLPFVRLDDGRWSAAIAAGGGPRDEDLADGPLAENLAYIVYTSGTTGRPKGVGVTHASLGSAFRAWERLYDLPSLSTHLQMAAPGFDVFTGDVVRALGSGGALVLCGRDTLLDPPALAALVRAHRVEFAEFVPATLRELSSHLLRAGERLESLRLVAVGSDTWSMADLALFRGAFGRVTRILNTYGVTEATIDSTAGEMAKEAGRGPSPSIGSPLENTAALVLDANLEPLPDGVRGDLYLGGPAVARGYIGRADLTAERFLPDPHGVPGARMYRTGDRARRLADGRLEFLGRSDAQIKIRGYRVEPAEIEAALESHPNVGTSVVLAREKAGVRRLVAYVRLREAAPDAIGPLRAYLESRLPEFMVPSAFVVLDTFPLSANGKIDRHAIPEPEWGSGEGPVEDEPATEAERALAEVWKRVLGLPRVGTRENFFELGGDSILVIQAVSRAREAGVSLTPRLFFEHPTIAALARASQAHGAEAPSEVPAELAESGEVPLTPMQRWFFAQEFEEPDHWNMAMALDAEEDLDPAALRLAAREVLDHHDALRARFSRRAGNWYQRIAPPGSEEAPVDSVEALPAEGLEDAVARCATRLGEGLDLERGPMIRFGVVGVARVGRSALVVVAHHLAVDGVSLRLIAEDLERAYRRARRGETIHRPARTASAGRWTLALEEAVKAGRFNETVDHWKRYADAGAAPSPLQGARPGPAEGTTGTLTVALDARATAGLLGAAGRRGTPVETVLLAALATAWASWTEGSPLDVELEGHGRDALPGVDLGGTVGWFTETLPVRIDIGVGGGAVGVGGGAVGGGADLPAAIEAVALAISRVPPASHGALRWLSADPGVRDILRRVPSPPVSFNYLGRFDAFLGRGSVFMNPREPRSSQRSPRAHRTHALEIDAVVTGAGLLVRWAWSRERHDESTIACLAAGFREALAAFAAPPPSVREEAEEVLAPTPMQEGMLFHHLRGAGRDPYVAQIVLELTGTVDTGALARAWQFAFDVHPALRTDFAWEGLDRPVRVIRSHVTLPVAQHAGRGAEIDEIMTSARAAGFDIGRAPLARIDIVRSDARRTAVLFTHHHLLFDGWSLPFVLETVFQAYDAFVAGILPARAASTAPPLYAEWLATRDVGAAQRFFAHSLSGFASATSIPWVGKDLARSEAVAFAEGASAPAAPEDGRSSTAARASGVVHATSSRTASAGAGFAVRARALGLTPGTVIQAAWALVLAACSGERDVVFGATSSGRSPEVDGIESLVGLCINTLPVRVLVDPCRAALGWMHELQRLGAELRQYEFAPLALVQRCAATPPAAPLFESLLVFENYPVDVVALGRREHFAVTGVRLHEETNYPLTLVASHEDGLRLRAIYDTSRYDEAGGRLVLDRLLLAIDGLLSRPDAALGDIPVLSEGERERVLVTWNETRRAYPRDATVVEVFEKVARERAEEVALVYRDGTMTYGELSRRSLTVSEELRRRGVGPESRVALAMDRSPELIVAMLGVLRAGGAYVPIDFESPPGRTAAMLADAGARFAVTDRREPAGLGACEPLAFDALAAPPAPVGTAPRSKVTAENLAYVMFTSGSTGAPKGIEVTHRNILRLVLGSEYAALGPGQTILQLAPVAFDASTFEIWGALLCGGRLAIAPPGPASAAEIARLLRESRATAVWLTAGLFGVVVEEELAALAGVDQVLAGGDVLPPAHVRRLLDAGCARVVNGYGPTETTTFACCETLSAGDTIGERVPIGRPIANARAYVLDGSMRPVPVGAPGELLVGGDGVSRGYARRPDLTAERFVPDPFGPPGERLYRTGDLVRWRADGRLEFLGRRDGQRKVRGFRVELGEIESALSALPGVRAAVVDVRGAEIVGWLVGEGGEAKDAAYLRAALAAQLPRYMIPARFIFLEALPLTANGKVDRGALPEPGPPPRPRPSRVMTPVEDAVADLWRRILGVDRIGPEDDFFELGGHSLHATRLLSALRRAFRIEIPMAALFEATSVSAMARALIALEPEPGHALRAARAIAKLRSMKETRARERPVPPRGGEKTA